MELYRQKKSKFWHVTYTDKDGRRVRRSTKTEDRRLAEEIALKWVNDTILEQHWGVKPPVPFNDCLLRYAALHKRDHAKSFKASTFYRLNTLTKHFGGMIANDIDELAIRKFINVRREVIQSGTVRKEVSTLMAILNLAVADGYLDKAPKSPKLKKAPSRMRWLTYDEEDRLCDSVSFRARHLVPLIRLACDTGGRRSELLNLDWKYVDLANRRLTFVKTKNGSDRTIRLCDRAVETLLERGPKASGPVFSWGGRRMGQVSESFRNARKAAGMPELHFHDLRHTFASRLVQGGVSLFEVMKMLGHSSYEMVQVYAHLQPDYQNAAIEVLNRRGHNPVIPANEDATVNKSNDLASDNLLIFQEKMAS